MLVLGFQDILRNLKPENRLALKTEELKLNRIDLFDKRNLFKKCAQIETSHMPITNTEKIT
jgi:hypothetical protein